MLVFKEEKYILGKEKIKIHITSLAIVEINYI